jgi:hypothetical protein
MKASLSSCGIGINTCHPFLIDKAAYLGVVLRLSGACGCAESDIELGLATFGMVVLILLAGSLFWMFRACLRGQEDVLTCTRRRVIKHGGCNMNMPSEALEITRWRYSKSITLWVYLGSSAACKRNLERVAV